MAQFNYLSILGKVETAPTAKTLASGMSFNEFTFSWEDSYISKAGVKMVNKHCIDVTLLEFLLKKLDRVLHQGDSIILEGHLRASTWGQEGAKRTKHSITASNIVFIDQAEENTPKSPKLEAVKKAFPGANVKSSDDGINFVDELPF